MLDFFFYINTPFFILEMLPFSSSCLLQKSVLSCISTVDHSRYLVGDANGRILMLFLEFQESKETGLTNLVGMKLEELGEVCHLYVCVHVIH